MRQKKPAFKTTGNKDNSVTITIPFGVYSKDTILKACYKYSDLAYVKVGCIKKNFTVEIKSKDKSINTDSFIDQLFNDLIDFELREIIASQTAEIRSALVEKAFSS